ncbi:hypothetical protein RND71_000832 [Anisodus tanguticus]|uniref:mitogen-activated protein kinase kinase kinase n=1 Tax=Anisodus tanguticus TaxID=243964 RepID=A0AAE1VY41_9SOLA|nr:hypothetical protein RND71_000832 [Anisodus tanguticus]
MQDIFGSVRRSLVFRTPTADGADEGNLVEKINSCIRNSRVFSKLSPPPRSPITAVKDDGGAAVLPIRWRKGEMIGCGAFGQVYMGMNLDSGELLAVKQVMIAANSASKEKAQSHVKELEKEVKLLKNLSHPHIVVSKSLISCPGNCLSMKYSIAILCCQRYLGIVREEDTLNILLEFVPGGSISSLLGKFGSFPEPGANVLVDNKGCIKLADFGASKKVVELRRMYCNRDDYWQASLEPTVSRGIHFMQHPFVTGEAQLSLPDGSSSMMCFNPIAKPSDDWNGDYGLTPPLRQGNTDLVNNQEGGLGAGISTSPNNNSAGFCGPSISEDEDELTESKIRAFLDEKLAEATVDETTPNFLKLPPKSRSPSQGPIGSLSTGIDLITSPSPGSSNRGTSCIGSGSNQDYDDSSPESNERRQSNSPIASFSEIQRKWKEELDQELERKREMMRQAGVGGKTSSPKDQALNRQRERSRFASPGK